MSTGYEKPPREPLSTVMQVLRDAGLTPTLTPDRIREQLAHLDRGDGMTLTDAEQRALCNMALAASRDDASMADKRDAERYRGIFESGWFQLAQWSDAESAKEGSGFQTGLTTKDEADAAIDAAMSAEKGG